MSVKVEEITTVTPELITAFERLTPQLSSSSPPPSSEDLEGIVNADATHLLVARADDGTITGTTTLVVFRIPTGVRAHIEDVVVDTAYAGQGISYDIARFALDVARRRGAKTVDLTSRPSRAAANHVYQKLGFEQRETNVYRFTLD